jgi:CRP/FNR family transcriptional regulator
MREEYKIETLKKIDLFSSLTEEELQQITCRIAIRSFKKNGVILYEEDTNEFMYIILEGEVKVVRTGEEGKEIILAMHRAGEFFGEVSLIDGKTIPATVLATTDSITAVISKNDFYALIFSQNKVLEKLLRILCFRLRESLQLVQMLNFNNASQRVKMLFMMLSKKYGKKVDGEIVLDIKLTHQDIAEMTGMTRETVTRVIDKWQKDDEIAILKDKRIQLTPDFLERF